MSRNLYLTVDAIVKIANIDDKDIEMSIETFTTGLEQYLKSFSKDDGSDNLVCVPFYFVR